MSTRVIVSLPGKQQFNFDQSVEILRQVLARAGHPACYSGLDISFITEVSELTVNPDGEVAGDVAG